MLKLRVIPVLLLKEVGLVKGVRFDSQRRVGSVLPAVTVYNNRCVDELVLLDVTATLESREPDYGLVEEVSANCSVPLSVGGGIRTLDSVKKLLRSGADKVVLNSVLYEEPDFVSRIAEQFGSQCVVASIDVRWTEDEGYFCCSRSASKSENVELLEWISRLESLGVGEILITSIDRDGTMQGYDQELICQVSHATNVPVIAAGGAGSYEHLYQAILSGASAVAASSMFQFTEQTPLAGKQFLGSKGLPVRIG